MAIKFEVHESCPYFISYWEGAITNSELIPSYSSFFESSDWNPGLHELADLTKVDMSQVTTGGMIDLANWTEDFYREKEVRCVKAAVLISQGRGESRPLIYQAWAVQSPEQIRIFQDRAEAVGWLTE